MPRKASAAARSPACWGRAGNASRRALAEQRAQERVDEARGRRALGEAREIDRVVHDGGRGHAVQVQDLVKAEPQDGQDSRVRGDAASRGGRGDNGVQRALPAQRALHDLGSQCLVARVVQSPAAFGQRGGQVQGSVLDGRERPVGRDAGRRGHGEEKRSPITGA